MAGGREVDFAFPQSDGFANGKWRVNHERLVARRDDVEIRPDQPIEDMLLQIFRVSAWRAG